MALKVALIPNDFYTNDKGFEDVLATCNEIGVSSIEIAYLWGKSILDLDDGELDKLKALLAEKNISVASIQTQIMKTFPAGSRLASAGSRNMHRDEEFNLSRIDDAIKMADALGTKYIITYSYYTALSRIDELLWERLLTKYSPLVEKCEAAGKVMVVECEGDTLVGNTGDYLRLFGHFNSPALKANLDLSNFVSHAGDFTEADFDQLKEHVEYFHVKDRTIKKSLLGKLLLIGGLFRSKAAVFDEGDVPWRRVLPWFIDHGYDGILSVEPHVHGKEKYEKATRCAVNLMKLLDELGVEYS